MATAQVAPARPGASPSKKPEINPTEAFHWLRCVASVEIAVANFKVGDLLNLRPGSIVRTKTAAASDVPVRASGILLGWARFETAGSGTKDERLCVRLTEMA